MILCVEVMLFPRGILEKAAEGNENELGDLYGGDL